MQTDVMSQLVYRAVLTLDEKKEVEARGKNRHRIFFSCVFNNAINVQPGIIV